ncbi:MAG: hypothetical protein WBQ73_02945 [Candidatus Babeliales bacterium]
MKFINFIDQASLQQKYTYLRWLRLSLCLLLFTVISTIIISFFMYLRSLHAQSLHHMLHKRTQLYAKKIALHQTVHQQKKILLNKLEWLNHFYTRHRRIVSIINIIAIAPETLHRLTIENNTLIFTLACTSAQEAFDVAHTIEKTCMLGRVKINSITTTHESPLMAHCSLPLTSSAR